MRKCIVAGTRRYKYACLRNAFTHIQIYCAKATNQKFPFRFICFCGNLFDQPFSMFSKFRNREWGAKVVRADTIAFLTNRKYCKQLRDKNDCMHLLHRLKRAVIAQFHRTIYLFTLL